MLGSSLLIFDGFQASIVYPVVLGLALPTLFTEPHFTGPRTALATSSAQVGAYFAAERSSAAPLWNFLLLVSIIVAASSVIAMLTRQAPGQIWHWISTRIGRVAFLGSILTVILLLQVARRDFTEASWLAVALFATYAVLFLDWARLTLNPSRGREQSATITTVRAPNQLLVRSFGRLDVGTRVVIEGRLGRVRGSVAEDLASASGSQYAVVLDDHWREVTDGGETPCTISVAGGQEDLPLGFAMEGSSEQVIVLNPTSKLQIGQTLELRLSGSSLLYQVAGLSLVDERWATSAAIAPRARLVQVGAISADGLISARPTLPLPYQPLFSAENTANDISPSFLRIGKLKGTQVAVGIRRDWESNHGHLAVLGMSGMGKTTVAAKLAQLAGGEDKFVILDETSEYRTRLSFGVTEMRAMDWNSAGVEVFEPGGELPQRCEDIIKGAMTAAQSEYQAGEMPRRRYLLLEEAHGWLPEWNFTTRDNADATNRSCRYILQARKFNLSFVMISQRTAVISKSAISQCENYIILRTLDQTSLDYVEGIIGLELKGLVSRLGKFEAICVGPIFNSDAPIIVSLDPAA